MNNNKTANGINTFYGMGIIAVTTTETEIAKFILRVKVTAEYITAVGKINITCLKPKEGTLPSLRYDKLPDFTSKDKTKHVDILWQTSWLLQLERPSWNDYMQMVSQGSHPGVSSVFCHAND